MRTGKKRHRDRSSRTVRRLFTGTVLIICLAACGGISNRESVSLSGLTGQVPLVTFVFDDGNDTDYLVAREIFAEQGAVACSAITTDWINRPGYMSTDQIIGLRDAGWEIMGHTATHPNLRLLSSTQVEEELSRSKSTLEDLGLGVKNLVYPYNKSSEKVRAIARRHYRSGRGGTNAVNGADFDQYNIKSYSTKHDLVKMQRYIDRAYINSSWIVFYHHQVDIKVSVKEGLGKFILGEKLLFSPSGAIGRYQPPTWYLFFGSLYFVPLSGSPKVGEKITGASSGASARVDRIIYDERALISDMLRYVRTRYPDMRIVTIDQGLYIIGAP